MYYVAKPFIKYKGEADRTFLNNILRFIKFKTNKYLINTKYFKIRNPLLILRKRRAYKYYLAVKHFGGPAFWKDKNE